MNNTQSPSVDHDRIARSAILNGVTIPAVTIAVLRSRGVDVGALENRVRATVGMVR